MNKYVVCMAVDGRIDLEVEARDLDGLRRYWDRHGRLKDWGNFV